MESTSNTNMKTVKTQKKQKKSELIYPSVIISHHMLMGLKQKMKGEDEEKMKGEIIKSDTFEIQREGPNINPKICGFSQLSELTVYCYYCILI